MSFGYHSDQDEQEDQGNFGDQTAMLQSFQANNSSTFNLALMIDEHNEVIKNANSTLAIAQKSFCVSYGAWSVLALMLSPLDFLQLQALNKYCY